MWTQNKTITYKSFLYENLPTDKMSRF